MINIKHSEKDGKGIFEALEEEKNAGEMTYVKNKENLIIIDHTEVNSAFEGKGIGKQLVDAGADYARTNHLKILPLCPFASKVMKGNEKYADVLV